MSKNEGLRVSLAIRNIVMSIDENTRQKIDPYLQEIEDIVASDALATESRDSSSKR